jgi:glucose-1-phosphate cytidylyltransferase
MKVGILAGGAGSRLAEETQIRPKPMVEIGGRPILWHIMRYYAHFGFKNFAVALGYKGDYIKDWFANYVKASRNMSVDFAAGEVTYERRNELDWKVDLIETGQATLTGGRIKRLAPYLGSGTFMMTWGDGVANVDLHKLLAFHKAHGKLATLTAVRPPARYGHLEFAGDRVCEFAEKPQTAEGWINGAFFVLEPQVFDYIDGDMTMWEHEPLQRLAGEGQLMAYKHDAFWQCMDTLREKRVLEDLWNEGQAPWKVWKD